VKHAPHRPILITDAQRSQEEQLRSRELRYLAMMSVRVACLVLAAALVSVEAPLLWLWLPLCAAGMIIVPWLAVLLANDRPPKDRHRRRVPGARGGRALAAATPQPPAEPPGDRTIDG
jgi:hypothetical protein